MPKIGKILAREILDSRGNPTVETSVFLKDGQKVNASVPSGASIGKQEAVEKRDHDQDRFWGMGVLKAVKVVNEVISPKLVNFDPIQQLKIDQLMIDLDHTKNKSRLGANSILSVSLAVCKAGATVLNLPLYRYINQLFNYQKADLRLPCPIFNLINGGKHCHGNLDFQEFLLIPKAGINFSNLLRIGSEVYQAVKMVLVRQNALVAVGDEGGFAPKLLNNTDAFEILKDACKLAKYQLKKEVVFGLDAAANNFYKNKKYYLRDQPLSLNTNRLLDYYQELVGQYPIELIEDPFYEDDWIGWKKIMANLKNISIVGDDLITTNIERLIKAESQQACRVLLAKPNQIGTITETIKVIKKARQFGWKVIVSHRSGETTDAFITDFAVGAKADFVKFGAPARGERVAKYNRLTEIEQEINHE